MADRVLQRRDTEARWEAANPVLAEGELGIITDTKGYKIGDGVTAWNDLPYPSNPTQVVDTLGDTLNAVSQRLLTSLFSEGYLYAGVATPTTNPGTPEGRVFYLAIEQGYYPNFDNIQIQQYREICVFKWDGASWTKDILVEFHETAFIKGGEYVSYGDNYILAQAQTIFGGTDYPEDNLMLSAATTTEAGVMSAADKRNLESLKEYLLDNSKAETLPRDLLTTPPSVKPQSDKVTLEFSGVRQSSSDGYQDDMIEGEVDIPAATAEKAGVMTAEDKDNLYHLAHIASSGGQGGILYPGSVEVEATTDKVNVGLPYRMNSGDGWDNGDLRITIPAATADDAGVMTAEDKRNLGNLSKSLGIKTVVFPQASMVNLDLNNNKVIIKAGNLYVTYFNSNDHIHTIEAQEIDIADKLSANSALVYNITDRKFKFFNFSEQFANIKIDDAIVVLLDARRIYYQSCDIYINGVLNGVLDAKEKAYDLSNNINGVYPTLNHLAATDISLDFNGTTGHYTYKAYNVLWGKGNYANNVPAGEGDYLARKNTEYVVPMGLNGIFFNTSTKQLVWCEFDRFADYSGKDWVVLNFFVFSSVIPLFDNGMQVTKDGKRTDVKGNLSQNIERLLSGLGLKLGNHIHASDLFMGYYDGLFNMSVPSDVPNTTIERVFSKELGKYVLRAEISPGTTVPEGYKRTNIFTLNESYPEGTELYVSALFRLQTSNNYTNRYPTLIPLINGTWVDRYNGNLWTPFYAPDFTANSNDGKWHRLSFKIRATNGGAINKIDLSIYYGHGSDYINGGCVLELTDLYVGETDPGYSPAYNEDDLERPDVDLSGLVDNNAKGCVFMSLGDSITTEGYYIEKLRQLLKPSRFFNLAVAGATWADRSGTSSYDGNPLFQGDANQNVMGNQVQKIIDNPETYNVDPDIIIMAAGTNDGLPVSADKSDYEMRVDVDSHFNSNSTTPIQVTEPTFDDSDTFKEHRKTIAGAMRYCVLKLQQMYPKARIYILTPIQGSYNPNKDYVTQIEVKQRYITEVAKHLATPVIHVGEECGINRDFEYGGTYWKSEYDPQSKNGGRDLVDGLHPNTNGGWKMANYIYRKIIEDYIPQYYE
jgi:hypothetical protein